MITIQDFSKAHIEDAEKIALMNYNEERAVVTELPQVISLPDLLPFVDNGLGVAAFEQERMIGFLCCYDPWERAFDSTAKGTYSPIHAHGAIKENRGTIYKRLYQAAAEKWIKNKISYHAIGLYAHDKEAISSLFSYGFGLRCIDAIRPMETFQYPQCEGIHFQEIMKSEVSQIRSMRQRLSEHLGCSPCFMYSSPQDFQNWLARAETRNSRVFIAKDRERPIAFVEITESGENFATEVSSMQNICGAFCLPELRGKGIMQGLINYTISILKAEGYKSMGVDFESFNPTAYGFWAKYFTAYTSSVVRRIDECAIHD